MFSAVTAHGTKNYNTYGTNILNGDMRGSRNFRQRGGGGGPGQSNKIKRFDNVFFSPQLILQKSNGQFQRNLSPFLRFQRGYNIFQGGGGSHCLFPTKTHITCDFPGGGSEPPAPPPLWIRTWVT